MGASAWYEHWWGRLQLLRDRVADLQGAPQGSVALLPSTSAALSGVVDSVPQAAPSLAAVAGPGAAPPKRNRVVISDLDFPTLAYQFATRPELDLVILESVDGVGMDPQQYADAVDERTLFLATSHVFYATGFVQDLEALGEIARRAGAWSLIDGYHGAGQVPVDCEGSGVDFYTSGPLKWLCGGPGLSYLYVRPEITGSLRPRATSWFSTQDQFAFDLEGFHYHEDARRFEMGTPALPTVHTALGGQELLEEVGWETVFARNRALTERLMDRCHETGFSLRTAVTAEHRSAIVMIAHPDPRGAVAHLDRAGIIVDARPGHVRVSPHVYNTEDEVDQVVAELVRYRSG
jgi:selenocysteine lyase/cysteine desulfurase